jgi:hypothetical protein
MAGALPTAYRTFAVKSATPVLVRHCTRGRWALARESACGTNAASSADVADM